MFLRRFTLASLALALGACGSPQGQGTRKVWPHDRPPVVEGVVAPPVEVAPAPVPPEAMALPEYPRTAEEISGAAVTSLMRQARAALDGGRPEQAASALERALRIEPRNYFVWSMLGQTYLAQDDYAQAESVARKSNALARGNVYVELENWRTMAAARLAQGDNGGWMEANARAAELERWLYTRSPQ